MKKRIAKWLFSLVGVYSALWGATYLLGASLLEHLLAAELRKEWNEMRAEAENRSVRVPQERESMAFAGGPDLKVRVISCPMPFVCVAEVDRKIGGLNGRGAVGKYLLTPWRAFVLYEHDMWIS